MTSRLRRPNAAALACFAVVALNACGGGSGGGGPATPAIAAIAVSPSEVTLEALGATGQLEATARDQNGSTLSARFSWTSSDTAVVTVDANGLATAVNNGTATVTARSGSVSDSVTITVEQKPARIALSHDEVTMRALGDSLQLEASVFDANDHPMSAEPGWESSDAAVAEIDAYGMIIARSNGTATVTASIESVSGSVAVTVQQAISRFELVPQTATLTAFGQQSQMVVFVLDANGHPVEATLSFTSSDPGVATIDNAGRVTALSNGTTAIRASTGSVSASVTVTVRQTLARIVLAPGNLTLTAIGDSAQIQVTPVDANRNPMAADVILSSSDPAVASVDAAALVTAQANGMAIVTAATGTVSASVPVTVNQQVASIGLAPVDSPVLYALDATVQLHATARDANGYTVAIAFDWASSDPSSATVDNAGLVTARGHGTAEVSVSSGVFSDSVTIGVSLYPTVTVTPASSLLEAFGATAQLEVRLLDANGQEVSADVEWASSDPAVAAVSASGLVTAHGNGAATITARSGNQSGAVTVQVLQRIADIRISPVGLFLDPVRFTSLGETVQFTFEAVDPNGHEVTGAVLSATPREDGVVSIDDRFRATAIGNGYTVIDFRAEWAGNRAVKPNAVRVRQVATSLEIEPTARSFTTVGETHRFSAMSTDANGYPLPADLLYWEAADRRVAQVDPAGLVSIAGIGNTTVRVFTDDGLSASASVTGDLKTTCGGGERTPFITSTSVTTLVEGATIEVRGRGFCGESAGNLVTVDGMAAAVEALSESRLSVTVPQFDCLPSRRVPLAVAVGENRTSRVRELRPDEPVVPAAVGRQAIWGAGEDKCLQFSGSSGDEAYLIGVQSVSLADATDGLTPVRMIAATSEAGARASSAAYGQIRFLNARQIGAPAATLLTGGSGTDPQPPEGPSLVVPFHPVEERPAQAPSNRPETAPADTIEFPPAGDIERLPEEDDTVTLPGSTARWVVRKVGAHALWLVDSEYAQDMEAQYPGRLGELSEAFDNGVYPAVADLFGAPNLGNIARVVMTISRGTRPRTSGLSAVGARSWYRIAIGLLDGSGFPCA